MKIIIKDITPSKSTLELVRYNDIYGSVILTRGWR